MAKKRKNEDKKYTHVYSNVNYHQGEAKNFVLENAVEYPVNPVAGQIVFNSGSREFEYYDGTNWKSAGGAGALIPMGTIGTSGADFDELPTKYAEVKPGYAYFAATDGYFGGRYVDKGDFLFVRSKSVGDTPVWKKLKYFKAEGATDAIYLAEGKYSTDTDGHPYFDEDSHAYPNHRQLFNQDGSTYDIPDTGSGYRLVLDDVTNKFFVKYGDETSSVFVEADAEQDIAEAVIAWALVPAGGRSVVIGLEPEDVGQSQFVLDNPLKTNKVIVTVRAKENTQEGFEIDEGEVVIVDTRVYSDPSGDQKVALNFGHLIYPIPDPGHPERDATQFEVMLSCC